MKFVTLILHIFPIVYGFVNQTKYPRNGTYVFKNKTKPIKLTTSTRQTPTTTWVPPHLRIHLPPSANCTFQQLTNYTTFLDKTLLIRDFFSKYPENSFVLFQFPRGFGKTVNLQMMKFFVQQELYKNRTVKAYYKTAAYRFFANESQPFKITDYKTIITNHLAQYPVIHLDLSDVEADSSYLLEIELGRALRRCFQPYQWLFEKLEADFRANPNTVPAHNYELHVMQKIMNQTATREELPESIYLLARILRRFFDKKVFVFVDNYDAPLVKGMTKSYFDFKKAFYLVQTDLLGQIFKQEYMQYYVAYGFITGLTDLAVTDRINVQQELYIDSYFSPHYGVTEYELEKLLDYHRFTDYQCREIRQFYQNVIARADLRTEIPLYNTYAITSYIRGRNQTKNEVLNYWLQDGVLRDLVTLFKISMTLRRELQTLVFNGSGVVHNPCYLSTFDIWIYQNYIATQYENINRYELKLIFKYLYHNGYIAYRHVLTERQHTVVILEEFRIIVKQKLLEYYLSAIPQLPQLGEWLIALLYGIDTDTNKNQLYELLRSYVRGLHPRWEKEANFLYRISRNETYLGPLTVFEFQAILHSAVKFWYQHDDLAGEIVLVQGWHQQRKADMVIFSKDHTSIMIIRITHMKTATKAVKEAKTYKPHVKTKPLFIRYLGVNVYQSYAIDVAYESNKFTGKNAIITTIPTPTTTPTTTTEIIKTPITMVLRYFPRTFHQFTLEEE